MNRRRGTLALGLLLAASCGGVEGLPDGSSGFDGSPPEVPDGSSHEVPDGGSPELPDTGPLRCSDPQRWYRDLDGDRHGDPAASVESCEPVEGFVESGDDCDDACATCYPGAAEVCDGRDNDCDGSVDQTFACAPGAMVGCTTACGTAGMGACTAECAIPNGAACAPPAELCNGADDDCDGAIDDGFTCAAGATAVCTTSCGSTGTGACTSACEPAAPEACTPPAESCNGVDDDCDGAPDNGFACALGASVSCTTSCGTTGTGTCTSACAIPSGAACTPPAEVCNGADDDCDGVPDNGFTCAARRLASCTTSCGSTGIGFCTGACTPASPSACAVPTETCNSTDDDCDGLIDEGVMRVGPREYLPDYYSFVRPKVARGPGFLYAMWRMNSWTYLWVLDEQGRQTSTPRIQLETGSHFDFESNGSYAVYAYVDRVSGDVHVHRIATSPTDAAPYAWSRTIDTNVVEVELAVGSASVWVYTRDARGRVEYHTLNMSSGAVDSGSPRYVVTTPQPFAVTSNGFTDHLLAYYSTSGRIYWNIRRNTTWDATGSFVVDGARLRDIAIAGDYTTTGIITRRGLVIAYALAAGSGQPNELRYYAWNTSGETANQRLATRTVPLRPTTQLDLEMADGIALLGAVTTTSTTSSSGVPQIYQLARSATGAAYAATPISTGLPSAGHEGLSVVRFRDSRPVPDRLFYDPTEEGTASVPIGCF